MCLRSASRIAPDPRRRGLTLVELIVSLTVMAMVFMGMAGAVMLAIRAIPTGDQAAENIDRARGVIDQLAEDLRVAADITERQPNSITFTLADRNADGLPEVIRYSWSGVQGDPLVRKQNGVATDLLDNVYEFDLGYVLKDVVEEYPGPLVTSSEVELGSHDLAVSSQAFRVEKLRWIGQHLEPTLPADAVSWAVTRVLLRARKEGAATGSTLVQLRPATNRLPKATVLFQDTMWEALLANDYAWQEFAIGGVSGLKPTDALSLVIAWASGDSACEVEWDNSSGAGRLETADGGASWTYMAAELIPYYLYGTVVTPGATQTLTRHHVSTVTIGLRSGPASEGLVKTSVQTLNLPEALDALWDSDFRADPNLLDLDADGVADWKSSASFDAGHLDNGVWTPDGDLDTNPAFSFDAPTTVDLRFRDTLDDGEGGGIRLRVDHAGSSYGYIQAVTELDATNQQTLTIQTYTGSLTLVSVLQVPQLGNGFIDLRLLVDTVRNTCHVLVNGQDKGTFAYGQVTALTSSTFTLFESANAGGARFDSVRIRVGGTP